MTKLFDFEKLTDQELEKATKQLQQLIDNLSRSIKDAWFRDWQREYMEQRKALRLGKSALLAVMHSRKAARRKGAQAPAEGAQLSKMTR
jgi:hypothetical protein